MTTVKIKTKLTLGIGLLFALIILLGGVSAWYINLLKSDTENILVDNYNTLEYTSGMLASLEANNNSLLVDSFEINLHKQEANITEKGEQESTQKVRNTFELYKIKPDSHYLNNLLRNQIYQVIDLNMKAIERKNALAKRTAGNATFWIAIVSTLCFVIAFTLFVNLPAYIANPIKKLSDSIKQIAAKNYDERIHFDNHGEFKELAQSFNTMAQKLQEYSQSNLAKLMVSKKRIETLINNMHDPVIGLDENWDVIFVNEEAIKIAGIKEQEFIGQNAFKLAVNNDLIRLLIKDLTGKSVDSAQTLKIYANNKESYFEKETFPIAIIPTGEQLEKLIGHVIILRNVTNYKELDFAKTNFIATVSHEFKTPISAIKMSLQLLDNDKVGILNEEQKNLLQSINDDTNRLLKITAELLNMTQVESGNIQLAIKPSEAETILHYALEAIKTQAEQKQIRLDIKVAASLPPVMADNEKTAWVLTNLLSNAIRYSPPNENVIVQVERNGKQNKVDFIIQDKGQGIAPQYRDKIFDRYFRVPGTQTEGTGLGLAISKEFVEAQGGTIQVQSELGKGSTFTVSLMSVT